MSSPTNKSNEQITQEVSNDKPTQLNLNDLTALQSVDVIYRLLNKAAQKGVYSIDESHALKILVTRVVRELNENSNSE